MVLRDGTMRGGGPFFYTVGSYTCSGGKWKGEMTSQEHSPIIGTHRWARKISTSDSPGPIPMPVPNSKPRRWLANKPFGSIQSTGCWSRIE